MSIIKIKDQNGNIIEIPALKGKDYELTEEDKLELAGRIQNSINEAECIPLGTATNPLAKFIERTATEITAEDLEGVTAIGSYAFYEYDKLTSIDVPDSVTSIESSAFSGCSGLTSVRIGNGITSIKSNVFYGCTALTDIYIDKPEDSVSGAPWGATNAPVHWNTPLPSNS